MKPTLTTSQEIRHVYGCKGETIHVHTGAALLRTSRLVCPTCGAEVEDITNSPLGRSYFAFARTDLTTPVDTQTIKMQLGVELQTAQQELNRKPNLDLVAHVQWLKAKILFYNSDHYKSYKAANR